MIQSSGRVLALDLGEKRTGVAISDSQRSMALARPAFGGLVDQDLLVRQIVDCAEDEGVTALVVGLPRSLNGKESSRAGITRRFVSHLTPSLPEIPIELFDERLTTVEASRSLRDAGLSARDQKSVIDSQSAVILLEGWLACQ